MGCLNHRSSVSLFNTVKSALSLSLARALSRGPPPSHETQSTTGAQSCSHFWHTESWPVDRVHRRCAYDVTSKQEPELAGATTGSNSQCPRPGSATDLNRFNGRYVAGRSSGPQRRNGDSRVRSPWRRHDQAPRRFSGDMDGYTACAMEQQHRILIPAGISHRNGLAASFRPRAFMRNTASSSERSRGSQPLPFRPVGRQPFPLSQALGNVAHPYTQVAALVTRTVLILHHGQQSKRGIPAQACACVGQCVPAAARVVRACACLDQPVCACALYTPCTKDAAHSRTFDARQRRAIVEYTQRWRQRSPLQRLG